MTERDDALHKLRARVDWVRDTDDLAQVARPEAAAEATRLATAADLNDDLAACAALGWYHWLRARYDVEHAHDTHRSDAELATALQMFIPVVRVDPADVPEQIARAYRQSSDDDVWQPNSAARWNTQAIYLMRSYERNGQVPAALRAVELQRRSVAATPEGTTGHLERLANLGAMLRILADIGAGIDVLREAADVGRAAVRGTRLGDPGYGAARRNLSVSLGRLFDATGGPGLLEEAVHWAGEALADCPPNSPDRPGRLDAMLTALTDLGSHNGDENLLREAVRLGTEGVRAARADDWERGGYLANLGRTRLRLHQLTGDLDTLRQAAEDLGEAARATPQTNAFWLTRSRDAQNALRILAENTADPTAAHEAAREAVRSARRALADAESGSGSHANGRELTELGAALQTLFTITDEMPLLDEAIEITRRAARANDERGSVLDWSNLSNALRLRFVETGDRTALDEAIDAARRACAVPDARDADRALYQSNLSVALVSHAGTVGLTDLREAVDLLREASSAAGVTAPDRALYLRNLSQALSALAERAGDPTHQREALDCIRRAVSLSSVNPAGLEIRAMHVRRLLQLDLWPEADTAARELLRISGSDLAARTRAEMLIVDVAAVRSGEPAGIDALTEALALVDGHPGGAAAPELGGYADQMRLGQLFRLLYHQGEHLPRHLEAARSCYRRAAQRTKFGHERLHACRTLAELPITDESSARQALEAAETAVSVVPQVIAREAGAADRTHAIGSLVGLPAVVASVALTAGRPQRAVELLEATRGLLAAAVLDLEDAATARLRERAPAFADDFDALRGRLVEFEQRMSVAAGEDRQQALAREQRTLHAQWDELVRRIKQLPGLHGFPAVHDATELTRQAEQGPIVFVTSDHRRCDALILTGDPARPVLAVELPAIAAGEPAQRVRQFVTALETIAEDNAGLRAKRQAQRQITETLGWTWDAIAAPVLDRVEREILAPQRESTRNAAPLPRLWWCPVGRLAFLPLHAAGRLLDPDDGAPQRFTGVADRVVSSYTPTIRALTRARTAIRPETEPALAVVSEPGGAGIPLLPGADAETRAVLDAVPGAVLLDQPDHAQVRAALAEFALVHFACHALANPLSPQDGSLILRDFAAHPLTVAEIRQWRLSNAELAYLSACATALTGPALADESLHLTASFQLAGFRHVVGTLWPVRDNVAQTIATDFYDVLTAHRSAPPNPDLAARALHHATITARERYAGRSPTLWAGHIHVGP